MPNSYTKLYFHVVMAVKYRRALLTEDIQSTVFSVIGRLLNEQDCQVLQVNGIEDHVHALFQMRPFVPLSHVMQAVKARSSRYINKNQLTPGRFEWQSGYGAFSVGYRHCDIVRRYIQRQHQHHLRTSFMDEYIRLLTENDILFSPEYLFHEPL